MRFLSKMSVFYQSPLARFKVAHVLAKTKKSVILILTTDAFCCSLDAYPDTPCFVWACLASQRKLWHLYSCRVVTLGLHTLVWCLQVICHCGSSLYQIWQKKSVLWFQCSLFTLSVSVVKVKKTVTLPRLAGFRGSFSRSAFLVRLCRAIRQKSQSMTLA